MPYLAQIRLVLGIGEQVGAIEQAHGVVVEGQHIGDAVDLADQVHHGGHIDGGVDTVGLDAVVERLQPAGLGELAHPVEIDHQERVAAFRCRQLGHQLGVHFGVVDDFQIDVDAGRGGEFRQQRLDIFGIGNPFHEDVHGFRIGRAG
jgi:hypothetical protein